MTSITRYQSFVLLGMATTADGFGISGRECHIQWIMRIGMTAQTVGTLQILAMALMVMTFETGWNLAVPDMTFSAGQQFEVLGIGLLQNRVDLGMGRIHMAAGA